MVRPLFEPDDSFPPAPLWRRLMAIIYDGMLVIAIWFITTMLYMLIKTMVIGTEAMQAIAEDETFSGDPALTACLFGATFFFFAYFWQKLGQTLGMQVWRIRIQNADGTAIGWRQALLRFVLAAIAGACFGLGYLWMLWDKERKTWQDRYSMSVVVLLPKPPGKKKK